MAVTRYEWTCPGCGKRFAVREGLAPELCPECQSTTGPASVEPRHPADTPAAPSPAFASFDELTDEFVSRPRSTPALRTPRMRTAPSAPAWTIDLRFERFLTPHLLRAVWLLTVVGGIGTALLDIGMTASHTWTPQPTAVNPPPVGQQVTWNFLLLIARLLAVFVAVVYVRVVCEAAIVIFRMADNLEAIREATDRQSADRQP